MSMSDESKIVLQGHGLDAWAITPEQVQWTGAPDEGFVASNVTILWGGALDEEFLVHTDYAREVVDHLADALAGNSEAKANDVVVMATPVHVGPDSIEGTGAEAYRREVA